jgi:hypothetical protein
MKEKIAYLISACLLRAASFLNIAFGLRDLMLKPMNVGGLLISFGLAGLWWQTANICEKW